MCGVRLIDQGVDREGNPEAGYLPGMDVRAALTVVGDGPVGAVGRQLDREFGLPPGHHQREWAVGMKMVVDLPRRVPTWSRARCSTRSAIPEPEIFGFLYVHPEQRGHGRHLRALVVPQPGAHRLSLPAALHAAPVSVAVSEGRQAALVGRQVAAGIGPARRAVSGGRRLRAHRRRLRQHQRADRLGRGRSLDHRRATGRSRGRSCCRQGKPLTARIWSRRTCAAPRKLGGSRKAASPRRRATDSTAASSPGCSAWRWPGFTKGKLCHWAASRSCCPTSQEYYRGRIPPAELDRIVADCRNRGVSCHDALMERCGWPAIPYDGQLLVSHQDALLMGGKVQAPAGFADHVRFAVSRFLRALRRQAVHRDVLRPGDHAGRRRRARRSTARNACTAAPACGTAHAEDDRIEDRLPRRRRMALHFGRELTATCTRH